MGSPAPVPHRPPVAPGVLTLLDAARAELATAATSSTPRERYAAAHLAALRAAAAVLAAHAHPSSGTRQRGRPRSVWVLLAEVAPELAEWAAFFAAGAGKRAAAEAGLARAVTRRDADDLLRDAEVFLGLTAGLCGLPHQPTLPDVACIG